MSDTYEDRGDAWSRLLRWLKKESDDLTKETISGTLSPEAYQNRCAQISRIDLTLQHMDKIRLGEDIRRPQSRPVDNPEC